MSPDFARIRDVASINPATLAPQESDDGVPFISMASAHSDGTDPKQFPRPLSDVHSGYTRFEQNDILVAKITPCFENGKVAHVRSLTGSVGFGSTEFHVVRAGPDINARYLFHILRTPRFRATGRRAMTGSAGQKRIPARFISDFRIVLPSLNDQRRFANAADTAISLRQKQMGALRTTDKVLPSLFAEMFGDPLINDRGWPMCRLADVIDQVDAGMSMTGVDRPRRQGEWAVLKISAVTAGIYRPDECKVTADEPMNPVVPRVGDLLFSRANTRELVGATCLVTSDDGQLFLPDKLWILRPNPSKVTSEYLRFLLADRAFRTNLARIATGTSGSMLNLSQAKVLSTVAPLPPIELQRRFGAACWSVLGARESYSQASRRMQALENRILSDLSLI